MIEPTLAIQVSTRTRLVGHSGLERLVPSNRIFDAHARPEQFPCVVIGTAQTVVEPVTLTRSHVRATLDLHVWTEGEGLEQTKIIAGSVASALRGKPSIEGLAVIDWQVTGTRFLRDPAEIGHAIVTLEALVMELVA